MRTATKELTECADKVIRFAVGQAGGDSAQVGQRQPPDHALGINGTQESTFLRGFLDTALEQISASTFAPLKGLSQVTFDRPPAGVITLAAIPNDRFPTKSRTSLRVRTRYELREQLLA